MEVLHALIFESLSLLLARLQADSSDSSHAHTSERTSREHLNETITSMGNREV